jgi:hypothetical protein
MDSTDHRAKVRQLADDLAWLEGHCRSNPALAKHAGQLRFAAGLARNVVGPALDGQPPRPLFIASVGGAGTGKSTVVNILLGTAAAEANPQAGYTRHPTAYLPPGPAVDWPSYSGFLNNLRRASEPIPGDHDEDVYQVRRVEPKANGPDLLADFVVWDCPDMTTWAAGHYVNRLIEVAALADVVVYVASDERYNDAVPTEFLHVLVRAGKAVVVALTKMREEDAATVIGHFRAEVLGKLPGGGDAVPVVAIPNLTAEERADPAKAAARFRVPLVNQVLALCPSPADARNRTVSNAVRFLETAADGLVDVAKTDLDQVEAWSTLVRTGRAEFEERYRREFLSGESFRRFDATRDQILGMLDLPGSAKPVSTVLNATRLPYQFARDFLAKLATRPPAVSLPEPAVLGNGLAAWLDGLQADVIRRAPTHPQWQALTQSFNGGLKTRATDRFAAAMREFEAKETQELDEAGKSLIDGLQNKPGLLTLLRVGKVAADVTAVALVLYFTWPPSWWVIFLVILAVALTHQAVELVVRVVVERARSKVRNHRTGLVGEHLSGPLAAWLADVPVTGGTPLERLRQVLARVPAVTRELADTYRGLAR